MILQGAIKRTEKITGANQNVNVVFVTYVKGDNTSANIERNLGESTRYA